MGFVILNTAETLSAAVESLTSTARTALTVVAGGLFENADLTALLGVNQVELGQRRTVRLGELRRFLLSLRLGLISGDRLVTVFGCGSRRLRLLCRRRLLLGGVALLLRVGVLDLLTVALACDELIDPGVDLLKVWVGREEVSGTAEVGSAQGQPLRLMVLSISGEVKQAAQL